LLPVDFYFITRFMGVRASEYIGALWRPVCCAALMYVGVRIFGPPLPGAVALPASQAAYSLVVCILIGAPIYVLAIWTSWIAAGRPAGTAESAVLSRMRAVWNRVSVFGVG